MNCLLLLTKDDTSYVRRFAELLPTNGKHKAMILKDASGFAEINLAAKDFDCILTTDPNICTIIFGKKFKATYDLGSGETVPNYIGSIVKLPTSNKEVLVVPPMKQLFTTSTGMFLTKRYLSKLFQPNKWFKLPEFQWAIADNPQVQQELLSVITSPNVVACAVDIETSNKIYCIGFGIILHNKLTNSFEIKNYVLPLTDEYSLLTAAKALASPCEKIMQNGMFDATHLLTYNMPINNWRWDTLGMMHSWYSELPRRLDFIAAFMLRDAVYWKDEKKSTSMFEKYQYNAKDTYNTACIFLAWISEAPEWAKKNYLITFPEVFPMLHCGLEGILVDEKKKAEIKLAQETKLDKALQDIRTGLGVPDFNPNSPKQLQRMCKVLGVKEIKSTDAKDMQKYTKNNPLMAWVVPKIIEYKKSMKLLSTYINSNLYGNRLLYTLNPFGTETARTASKASNLYIFHPTRSGAAAFESYGTQVQNLPPYAKQMMKADEGWLLFEIDKSASESWCTAALSREEKLWTTLITREDFHCANASMFFGIPYEELYDISTGEKLNVPLRNLAKRVNHGANYNMGAMILVETMGEANIYEARRLILLALEKRNLQDTYQYKSLVLSRQAVQIATYLLALFDRAYPAIRGRWQQEIIREVLTTNKLVSPSGWTRYCFGNPAANKLDLNAYVAHGPQHLSVKMVNKSLIAIWRELALPLGNKLRLKAQIHDSIFGQYKIGCEEVVYQAEKLMQVKITVHGKELSIPNDVELNKEFWK